MIVKLFYKRTDLSKMSLVFSIQIELKSLVLKGREVYRPSLLLGIDDYLPTPLPWQAKNQELTQSYDIKRAFEFMINVDVFKTVNSWPITFFLTMQKDQVIVGSAKYEFKALIANALNRCGQSERVEIEAIFWNKEFDDKGKLCFSISCEYIPGNEHKSHVEIFASQPIQYKQLNKSTYEPRIENNDNENTHKSRRSRRASQSKNISKISQTDDYDFESEGVTVKSTANAQDVSSGSSEYIESEKVSRSEHSLLDGHKSFKAAQRTNQSRLESAQKSFVSTSRSKLKNTHQTTSTAKAPVSSSNDFVDEF